MNLDEDNNDLASESEDEDYIPGAEPTEVVSEEEEDGDPEEKSEKRKSRIRKKGSGDGGKKKAKRRKGNDGSEAEDSDDDQDDADFTVDDKDLDDEEKEEEDDPETISKREQAEKERTEMLWADFLSTVEENKAKRKEERESGIKRTEEKTVTKVYEFAGERVKVQEKIRVDSAKPGTSKSATNGTTSKSNGEGNISNGSENSVANGSGPETVNRPRKYRISFLSGNPSEIGLAGGKGMSAKEQITNVLHALHAKNKKIGTLEKSKLDWEAYKRDHNIEEELSLHTRSRNGFVDKQEFLQRADLRQFELEKEARTKRRRPLL